MTRYLVECGCGNKVPVDVGQAGGRVTCSCGAVLDVPPLRKLRHLPLDEVKEERTAVHWGLRQGILTASVIAAVALFAVVIWSRSTQPSVPKFDPIKHQQAVEDTLKTLTPAQGWDLWLGYKNLAEHGFMVFESSNRAEIEREIAHRQFSRRILWALSGIFAATAAGAAFWPAGGKTRRQGDKETRRVG